MFKNLPAVGPPLPPRTSLLPGRAEYYEKVTTTRKYEDRLATLEAVRQAGISVCAGGIIGLGEQELDRVGLLHQVGRGQGPGAGAGQGQGQGRGRQRRTVTLRGSGGCSRRRPLRGRARRAWAERQGRA